MKNLISMLGIMGCVLFSAQNAQSDTLTMGVGTLECTVAIQVFEGDEDENWRALSHWVSGFFSGLNAARSEDFDAKLRRTEPFKLFEAVVNQCRLNSTLNIGTAAIRLANAL